MVNVVTREAVERTMPDGIAVIIPHYQRTSGVLARTMAAVLAQDCGESLMVIVVDDESPVPAAAELAGLDEAARARVRLISRKNGGPAAAKNTGLMAVPADIAYIALSDRDDLWKPDHISRGMAAMRLGYDLFFCDHRREGLEISQFERCGISRSRHVLIDAENDIHTWGICSITVCGRRSLAYRRFCSGATRSLDCASPRTRVSPMTFFSPSTRPAR